MIFLIVSIIFSLFVIGNTQSAYIGEFDWTKAGTTIKGGISQQGSANGGVSRTTSSVSLLQQYQPRVYLMDTTSNSKYYRFPDLRGQSIRFTVDLSQSTCNCNAALYLVDLPSTYAPGTYADAQGSGNPACAEYDLIEANTHAFAATVHTGKGDTPGKNGCGWNVKAAQGYGPSGGNIDTTKPFTVDFSFYKGSSGTLTEIHVKLTQSGKPGLSTKITDSTCTWTGINNYVSSLDSSVKSAKSVLAMSYWSGSMDWLDSCSSGVTCPSSSQVKFSSFQIINSITALNADETSQNNDLPFEQSPIFIGIMCAIGILLLVGLIAFIIIRRKNALNQEIV